MALGYLIVYDVIMYVGVYRSNCMLEFGSRKELASGLMVKTCLDRETL